MLCNSCEASALLNGTSVIWEEGIVYPPHFVRFELLVSQSQSNIFNLFMTSKKLQPHDSAIFITVTAGVVAIKFFSPLQLKTGHRGCHVWVIQTGFSSEERWEALVVIAPDLWPPATISQCSLCVVLPQFLEGSLHYDGDFGGQQDLEKFPRWSRLCTNSHTYRKKIHTHAHVTLTSS